MYGTLSTEDRKERLRELADIYQHTLKRPLEAVESLGRLIAEDPSDTDVLVLPPAALLEFLGAHPAVGYVVMGNLASVVGQRLQVFQAMWLREMQRAVDQRWS